MTTVLRVSTACEKVNLSVPTSITLSLSPSRLLTRRPSALSVSSSANASPSCSCNPSEPTSPRGSNTSMHANFLNTLCGGKDDDMAVAYVRHKLSRLASRTDLEQSARVMAPPAAVTKGDKRQNDDDDFCRENFPLPAKSQRRGAICLDSPNEHMRLAYEVHVARTKRQKI